MPSGWDVYYVVFLSAVLALGIPLVLAAISYFVAPRAAASSKKEEPPYESAPASARVQLGQRMNTRFFLAANAALILITLILVLIPCVGTLQAGNSQGGVLRGLISIVTIAGFASLGLLYSSRKGDLGWLKSFQMDRRKRN